MMSRSANLSWQRWRDLALQAAFSLGDRRLRSFLCVLGIAIGVAAVILIGVVSEGGRHVIFSELETFGLRSTWVFRDRKIVDPRQAVREGSGIDNEDLAAIQRSGCCTGVARLSPVVYGGKNLSGFVRTEGRYAQAQVQGVGHAYIDINNDELSLGRVFTAEDTERGRYKAIIGEQVLHDLFPNSKNAIGQEIRIGGQRFTVTGVLQRKDRAFLSSIGSSAGDNANSRVLIPYRRMQAIAGNDQIDVIQAEVAAGAAPRSANLIADLLRRRHRGAFEYRVETMEQYVDTANNILSGVSTIGIIAASISLFVAGLGILNIMSTSVLERTREIGLRKAVGGSSSDILLQFLFEAAAISLMGGFFGLVLGGLGSLVASSLAGIPLTPSLPLMGVALGVSLLVGILSGMYPAYQAARLHPVQALRYE